MFKQNQLLCQENLALKTDQIIAQGFKPQVVDLESHLKASPRKVTGSDTIPKANEGTVRTRSGRLVKPVKRLLECMSMIISEPTKRDPLAELLRVLFSFVGS